MLRSTVQCICIIAILFAGCKSPEPKREAENEPGAGTPVTVTTISTGSMTDFVEVNATSAFLQKNYVKANVNGYVQSVDIAPGTFVHKGKVLFIIKTKEAQSIDKHQKAGHHIEIFGYQHHKGQQFGLYHPTESSERGLCARW